MPTAVEFRHGWNPTPAFRPRLRMDRALSDTATVPASIDYYTGLPAIGMLGNDLYGDCVFAGDGHIVEQQTFFGQGTETTVSTAQALAAYTAVTGFNKNDPSTDNGAQISDGLNYLRKTGMAGVQIAAYGQVSVSAIAKVKLAVYQFGAVSIGFNFPAVAMDQFNNGDPWDVVQDDGGIEGGHCVIVVGYDATYLYVYTWGAVQKMTYAFWNKYVEEAWPVISQAWVRATTGLDPIGVSVGVLGQEFTAVTGQPSPFPAPGPTPVDPPPPPPTDLDAQLWQEVQPWAAKNRTRPDLVALKVSLLAWAKAKGYYGS